jgi:hypothetical protein
LPIQIINIDTEATHGFAGFRPEKPSKLQFHKIEASLKGNSMMHYNALPCQERDEMLRYMFDWNLEFSNAQLLEEELKRISFHIAPIEIILGIYIKNLKESTNDKIAVQQALKQGRTRLKNVRRLERKASEASEASEVENPQTGDASGMNLQQMKVAMDKLIAAQAKAAVSTDTTDNSWSTSSSKKKSYYDKEKGGAKKGDKGDKGDKGKKGNKGDKGDKGKGNPKNDKGKGKKK